MDTNNSSMNHLSKEVFEIVKIGLTEAIKERLARGYNDNPLNKLIDQVVISKEVELRKLVEESIDGVLQTDFRNELRSSISHKLARVMTSKLEGEFEKRLNELRGSPEIRTRITLAIEKLISEVSK